ILKYCLNICSSTMLLLLLAIASVRGIPVHPLTAGSCTDAPAHGAAAQALDQINLERTEGYVLSLERLSNVHVRRHGEAGVVYYLTIDVLETKCHVLSKNNWRKCEVRDIGENPVYGQCRAVIYINKVHRVSRLYGYSCAIRPVPASRIVRMCPDCPVLIPVDSVKVVETMKMGMENFNKNSMFTNFFTPLNVTRATSQGGFVTFYNVEFIIQETVCSNQTDIAEVSKCQIMACEFAHKGLCRSSLSYANGYEHLNAECEIFEPEAAEEEKKKHYQGGELDHSHANISDMSLGHDHKGAHTHHHTHEQSEGHSQVQGHTHAHVHGHDHDHAHAHHSDAHNHTQDKSSHTHHNYGHGEGETHAHDHELALDHEHGHVHLHVHEHHHHHHEHQHGSLPKRPEGMVYVLPSMDKTASLSGFPVPSPAQTSAQPLHADPQIPGEKEPTIEPFPSGLAHQCPAEFSTKSSLIQDSFVEDPLF
uniref:Cystatin fetuin-B-type domain-containing protein n=2 Tax=Electrophorus electricus TaxID=8005 RepID=A0AAY5ECG5_ELEEL